MTDIFSTSGSKIYIGQAKLTSTNNFVLADFNSQSWVEIGLVEKIGQFGDESSSISFDALGVGRTYQLKGNRNAGSLSLVCAINYTDYGQASLRGAETTKYNYAFRVDFNDTPSGGSTPSKRYFVGLVLSAREQLDGANDVMRLNATIGINSNIVRVNAS